MNDHLELRPVKVKDGLGHHGEPDEEEVIVVEEPDGSKEEGPRVMRAPHTYHMRSGVKPAWQDGAGTGPTSNASPKG